MSFGELTFRAPSLEDWVRQGERNHPMGIAVEQALSGAGVYDDVRERAVGLLAAGNEDPSAFAVTSRYLVVRALKPPGNGGER